MQVHLHKPVRVPPAAGINQHCPPKDLSPGQWVKWRQSADSALSSGKDTRDALHT